MFWTADGFYFLGDFDGYEFKPDGVRHEAYLTGIPYAAQTIWGTEDIITIPWLRTKNKGKDVYRYDGPSEKADAGADTGGTSAETGAVKEFQKARVSVSALPGRGQGFLYGAEAGSC